MSERGRALTGRSAPAILLHGFTGSARAWDAPLLGRLGAAGLGVRALDLPGHGVDAGRDEPADFELDATLDRIAARTPPGALMIGYSMGGRIALHFACSRPSCLGGLVLESSSPGLETEAERARRRTDDDALAECIVERGMAWFVDRWEELPLFATQRRLSPDVRSAVRRGRLANDPHALAAALRGLGTGRLPSLWEALPNLAVPTLVMAGALDRRFVEIGRRMVERLPHGRLEVISGAGHRVHLERPDAWVDRVTEFAAHCRFRAPA